MNRKARNGLKKLLCWVLIFGQRFGLDILPRHFYSEIPDINKLRSTDWWRKEFSMIGVRGAGLQGQMQFIEELFPEDIRREIDGAKVHESACQESNEQGYGKVEADVLYAFIRKSMPQTIIQIGCGVSTAICLAASRASRYQPKLVCIEPYPNEFLIDQARQGTIELIRSPVEVLPLSFVGRLQAGDFFFVDSTHTLGPAGEVSRIILELLPRLNRGVSVHFHDIYFPFDYPDEILSRPQFFPHESVLLHAFLANNNSFEMSASLSMLHHKKRELLKQVISSYVPADHVDGLLVRAGDFPTSAYLKRTEVENGSS
jgi:hypothetical protein